MKFEVYCDESCSEVLFDRNAHRYLAFGSVWMPADFRDQFKNDINNLKSEYNFNFELKWNKVSNAFAELYQSLIKYFFSCDQLRFRSLVIESSTIDLVKFHEGDAELSFYKFYYQMLHHWILDFNEYEIFLDFKQNRDRTRIKVLREVLSNASLSSYIANVQSLPSHESLGIQLADFLLGAVNAKFNNSILPTGIKAKIIKEIETSINKVISPTPRGEEKFNIFKLRLHGGW
jgi:hypothetical protein